MVERLAVVLFLVGKLAYPLASFSRRVTTAFYHYWYFCFLLHGCGCGDVNHGQER
jgi:hypothetical protein